MEREGKFFVEYQIIESARPDSANGLTRWKVIEYFGGCFPGFQTVRYAQNIRATGRHKSVLLEKQKNDNAKVFERDYRLVFYG